MDLFEPVKDQNNFGARKKKAVSSCRVLISTVFLPIS